MIDIFVGDDGADLNVYDTQTARASNLLSVQIQSLEYAQDFGIDLMFFLKDDFQFQNDSFKAYLVETLANKGINVASLVETIESFMTKYTFNLSTEQSSTSFIAR